MRSNDHVSYLYMDSVCLHGSHGKLVPVKILPLTARWRGSDIRSIMI